MKKAFTAVYVAQLKNEVSKTPGANKNNTVCLFLSNIFTNKIRISFNYVSRASNAHKSKINLYNNIERVLKRKENNHKKVFFEKLAIKLKIRQSLLNSF